MTRSSGFHASNEPQDNGESVLIGEPAAGPRDGPSRLPFSDSLRVAVVHEWFVNYAGSERVVEQILKVFPQADLYALVDFLPAGERGFIGDRQVRTSFIQRLPRARKAFRNYLPLMPLAVEQFDLSGYDLITIRYAWDLQHQYLRESGLDSGFKSWIARASLHYLRIWDSRTANGVDAFLANSGYIARRIRKAYGRDSRVVYPPVDIDRFALRREKEDFYLAASRMVPYKRLPMIVEAFASLRDRKLVVIGDGPEFERVKTLAKGASNIDVLGYQPTDVLVDHMARARALIFAAEEDFGIMPVEAQACGTPVIAFGAGGALETVVASPDPAKRTGLFFKQQTVNSISDAIREFEAAGTFLPEACRANAERFSIESFRRCLANAVNAHIDSRGCPIQP